MRAESGWAPSSQHTILRSARRLLRLLVCVLQSLMERALAGQFDRSLKFGHSSGIWQVNDKGWEDDESHLDSDVSGKPQLHLISCPCASLHMCSR